MPEDDEGAHSIAEELLVLGAATAGECGALTVGPKVRAVWRGARLCGPAFTVSCVPADNLAVHVAVASAPESSVLVVKVGELEERGYWGEVLTTAAEARGLKGLVIEGCVRDVEALESHGFPVFSTGVALRGASKEAGGTVGSPVEIAGALVRSGDWILGDADGVAVIPSDRLEEVTRASRARAAKERYFFEELRAERTTIELLGLDRSRVSGP